MHLHDPTRQLAKNGVRQHRNCLRTLLNNWTQSYIIEFQSARRFNSNVANALVSSVLVVLMALIEFRETFDSFLRVRPAIINTLFVGSRRLQIVIRHGMLSIELRLGELLVLLATRRCRLSAASLSVILR